MSAELQLSTPYLPARTPTLTLALPAAGRPRLLAGAALPPGGEEELLWQTIPPLAELAAEAARDQLPLRAVAVRLAGQGVVSADLVPAGMRAGERLVEVYLTTPQPWGTPPPALAALVGESPALREVQRKILLYAASDAAVVITGETGTGKELVARALHDASQRSQRPYVTMNCSAVAEELLESELFGHEKGAFTGAVRTHRGRFERADGGTLFLDEIGEMPLHTQAKLLRVLEGGVIERLGGEHESRVDVRVVAATNVELEAAVGKGQFRADLYHRLAVLRIHLPPLRQRSEDIPLLVEHFLQRFNARYQRQVRRLTPEALELLQSYLWPGNVRELRNVLERIFVENQAEVIGARPFAEWIRERQRFVPGEWEPAPAPPLAPPYPLPEARLLAPAGKTTRPRRLDGPTIERALQAAGGNLSAAARLLGVHRATLYRQLERLGRPHSRNQVAVAEYLDRDDASR